MFGCLHVILSRGKHDVDMPIYSFVDLQSISPQKK